MKRTLYLAVLLLLPLSATAQQLPNMSFDSWTRSSGAWYPYASDAPQSDRVWDSANRALRLLGINGTVPEYSHLAVPGEGKAACKITSRNVIWAFIAGNIYTGRFGGIVDFKGALLYYGVPFKGRPKSLSGYLHYIPGKVSFAKEPYLEMKGEPDVGGVEVVLTDWSEPRFVNTVNGKFGDKDSDPTIIGRGVLQLRYNTGGYIHFTVPIEYRDSRTPSYIVLFGASSMLGEYFTGSSDSVLYLDELQFDY